MQRHAASLEYYKAEIIVFIPHFSFLILHFAFIRAASRLMRAGGTSFGQIQFSLNFCIIPGTKVLAKLLSRSVHSVKEKFISIQMSALLRLSLQDSVLLQLLLLTVQAFCNFRTLFQSSRKLLPHIRIFLTARFLQ